MKLAEFVFCPIPEIHTGVSVNFFRISSDANKIDALPEHGYEQSNIRRSSVIIFEFIICEIVYGSCEYELGLSIACL